MATIFDCNGPNCVEAFIETGICVVASLFSINGFRIIFRDRNKLLSRLNKQIYSVSMIQLILLSAYFAFWGSDFVISTIRCLRILNEILLCYLLAEIVFEESSQNKLNIAFKIVGVLVFIEWFWTAIISNDSYDYYCLQMDLVYLSGTTVILTLIACFFGYSALDQLRVIKEDYKGNEIGEKESERKAWEIKMFLGCDLLSAILQFGWDYWANMNAVTLEDCKFYYEAQDIPGIFMKAILKLLTLIISPLAIYYLLYFKQRNQFNSRPANVLDINVLTDRRSELAQELTDY